MVSVIDVLVKVLIVGGLVLSVKESVVLYEDFRHMVWDEKPVNDHCLCAELSPEAPESKNRKKKKNLFVLFLFFFFFNVFLVLVFAHLFSVFAPPDLAPN